MIKKRSFMSSFNQIIVVLSVLAGILLTACSTPAISSVPKKVDQVNSEANLSELSFFDIDTQEIISLSQQFNKNIIKYNIFVGGTKTKVFILPKAADSKAKVLVNNLAVGSGLVSEVLIVNEKIEVKVIAEDNKTSKTYTVIVDRLNQNSKLANLVPGAGTLTPAFSSTKTDYAVQVPSATASITFTCTAGEASQIITINDVEVESDVISSPVALVSGNNLVTIKVKAESGSETQYKIVVYRGDLSQNANLQSLTTTPAIALDPAFNKTILSYSSTVAMAVSSITVNPVVEDAGATWTMKNNNAVVVNPVTLAAGNNLIDIEVKAAGGHKQNYQILIFRGDKSTNANLSLLVTNPVFAFDQPFDKSVTAYSFETSALQESIKVRATVEDTGKATLKINGVSAASGVESASITLANGLNTIEIEVTAEAGNKKVYELNVTRKQLSVNNYLSSLVLDPAVALTPSFDKLQTSYTGNVTSAVTSVELSLTAEDTKSTIKVNSQSYQSPVVIALNEGSNVITIEVTAEDITKTRTYLLTLNRESTGLKVHFKRPASWTKTPKIHYWATTPVITPTTWPGNPMTEEGSGWWVYTIPGVTSASIIFNNDSSPQTANLTRNLEGWYDGTTNTWHDSNPDGPTVNAVPGVAGGIYEFSSETAITLSVTGTASGKYTVDGTDPAVSGISYTNGQAVSLLAGMSVGDIKTLKLFATDGTKTAAKSFQYKKIAQPTGLVIYFKKPANWAAPKIYYYETVPATTSPVWPGAAMSPVGGDWYVFTIPNVTSAKIIFSDGTNQIPAAQQPGFLRDKSGWYDAPQSKWFDSDPNGPQVSAVPGSTSFSAASVSVTLYVSGSGVTTGKYTLNGSDPAVSGTSYTDGTIITIGSGMNTGDSKVLKLYATNGTLEASNSYTYTKTDVVPTSMGAIYSAASTTFAIWSPDTSNVVVNLGGTDYTCTKRADADGYVNVYSVTVPGDHKLKEYQFKINGNTVRDPYGTMINNNNGKNIVMDMKSIVPMGGWVARPALTNREDAVIYEVHVRDFSIDSSSGVDASKRGKFSGMVQTGTTYNSKKTGIDHLKELGVTHVQILPFYDFATQQYNWGYDPVNYNIPEEQYSMTPNDYENRVREVKEMINEFHKNGIRVIMDVVYNHTFGPEMFDKITNKYYYTDERKDMAGCGIAVNGLEPMVSKFIEDSLLHWIEEYKVDGFRFDLLGIFTYDTVGGWGRTINAKYPNDNILLFGEPWDGYYEAQGKPDAERAQRARMGRISAIQDSHFGVFNPKYREFIKGNNDGTVKGFMFNVTDAGWNSSFHPIAIGQRGSIRAVKGTNPLTDAWDPMFAYDPEQNINYISAHDNFCLWDKIIVSLAKNVSQASNHQVLSLDTSAIDMNYAKRVDKFGMGLVLTAQGIPFIHAGDEILRTKVNNSTGKWYLEGSDSGAHNSYNCPDEFNAIRWKWKVDNEGIFNYYKELIAMRKARTGLRLTSWDAINTRAKTTVVSPTVVVTEIDEDNNVGNGYELVVVANSGNAYSYTLNGSGWKKIFDINGASNAAASGTVSCEGTAVTVFGK